MTRREATGFGLLGICAGFMVLLVLSLVGYVVSGGWHVLSIEFLTQPPTNGMREGGIWPAIFGTIVLMLVTAVSATPLGVACAIYLVEYAREGGLVRLIRLSIRNLSGVPSVVYGLFGVGLFVNGLGIGSSLLASGLTLGLLTLPWTITASEEALRRVPRSYRDGALALGATPWEAIASNVIPAALPGMMTGIILGLARAAGETAPILFTGVTFSRPDIPDSLFDTYMALPYHLYILSTQHQDIVVVRPIAFATATVLLGLVLLVNGTAAVIRSQLRAQQAQS